LTEEENTQFKKGTKRRDYEKKLTLKTPERARNSKGHQEHVKRFGGT